MKFKLHNKLVIKSNKSEMTFFNKMFTTIFDALSNLKPYNKFLVLGNGINDNQEITRNIVNPIYFTEYENISYQTDIENSPLYAKLEYKIDTRKISCDYISELGLYNGDKDNLIAYNYFYLIDENNPNGLYIKESNELVFEIYIYLTLTETQNNILTSGNNELIKFLLGNGLGDVYACRGSNYSTNRIKRELPSTNEKYLCKTTFEIIDNNINLTFSVDIKSGECNEILFLTQDSVFARMNIKEIKEPSIITQTISPKVHYVIDLNYDIKSVNSVKNLTTLENEMDIYILNYANSFGDKISTGFNNLFNNETPRFLSKDGNKIFFVIDDVVYGYFNKDFSIHKISTNNIKFEYVTKIISFEDNVFIITKIQPYIFSFKIINNAAVQVKNNFNSLGHLDKVLTNRAIDITLTKNNLFMLSLIADDGNGYTTYFSHDTLNGFVCKSTLTSNYNFSYLVSMYKNNFCDGQSIFLQEGETSTDCRIVTHNADETITNVYSSLGFHYTNNTKTISSKSRAVIIEKDTAPYLYIYYYPQVFEYELPLLSSAVSNYISTNLNYLIQKNSDNEYHIYNLIGYDNPEEFIDGFPSQIDKNEIVDFEFLDDTLLIFLSKKEEPIVAYNLNLNKTQIENVSSNDASYEIEMTKYNKLGINGEGVILNLKTEITLWHFQIKFLNLKREKMYFYFHKLTVPLSCIYLINHWIFIVFQQNLNQIAFF